MKIELTVEEAEILHAWAVVGHAAIVGVASADEAVYLLERARAVHKANFAFAKGLVEKLGANEDEIEALKKKAERAEKV